MSLPKITNAKSDAGGNVPQAEEGQRVSPLTEDEKMGEKATRTRATPSLAGDMIPEDMDRMALEKLRASMQATRRYWDKDAKAFVAEPDHATILRACELTLAYSRGRPVERKFELRGNVETFEDRKGALLKSPEGVRFLLAAGAIGQQEAADALVRLIPAAEGA